MVRYDALFHSVLSVDVTLCAAIVVSNVTLLLSIVSCKAARARMRNAMIVGTCLADLLVGAFTHPLYIHSYRTRSMFHSCELHVLLQLIGDYSQDFVCFWTLVTLGGWYVYRLVGERWGWRTSLPGEYDRLSSSRPPCLRCCDIVKKVLMVAWPWLAVLTIPIPILLVSVDPSAREVLWDDTYCPLHITFPARIAVLVIVFYLPMAALAMLVAGIGLASCSSAASPQQSFPRPAESLVEGDVLCASHADGVSGSAGNTGAAFTTASSCAGLEMSSVGGCAGLGISSSGGGRLDGLEITENGVCRDGVGRPSVSDVPVSDGPAAMADSDLERPLHMAVPMIVTLVCSLPLMIGWWFYADMDRDAVIIVAVTLHRLYLLRAALLPGFWFILPDLRKALASLRDRLFGLVGAWCLGGGRGERGEYTVAYSTLQESRDAPATAPDAASASGPAQGAEKRHNPFNVAETV